MLFSANTSSTSRRFKGLNILALISLIATPLLGHSQETYRQGQHLEPAYEGWHQNDDGTYNFMFGYMNENWEDELDLPIGENNSFSPGDADRGQPTHFLPRRNRFTFEVTVPSDWGDRELAWTVTANGKTRTAYATLRTDYLVDNMVIASETGSLGAGTSSPESRNNLPPQVIIQGDSVDGEHVRSTRVGVPLTIMAKVEDDGLPKVRTNSSFDRREAPVQERMLERPRRSTVGKVNGLFLSWNVYRGEGAVTINPPQVKPWEDTRAAANSPWGALWVPPELPEDGMHEVTLTFDEPGTYILWARADDGGLYHDQYVTVNVAP